MLGRKPGVAGVDGGRNAAMGRDASARRASSWQDAAFAQARTFRRQSGVGKTASRLPQNADRKLRLAIIDRVLRTAGRPALPVPAAVDPESLSNETCGRRTSGDHVGRIERANG